MSHLWNQDRGLEQYLVCKNRKLGRATVRQVQRKKWASGMSGKKRKFIREKRGWSALKENQHPPFLDGSSYIPLTKILWRDGHGWVGVLGIWWPAAWESASENTACRLGSWVGLMDHCDFILCLRGQHNEPSSQWELMWALSFQPFC